MGGPRACCFAKTGSAIFSSLPSCRRRPARLELREGAAEAAARGGPVPSLETPQAAAPGRAPARRVSAQSRPWAPVRSVRGALRGARPSLRSLGSGDGALPSPALLIVPRAPHLSRN